MKIVLQTASVIITGVILALSMVRYHIAKTPAGRIEQLLIMIIALLLGVWMKL